MFRATSLALALSLLRLAAAQDRGFPEDRPRLTYDKEIAPIIEAKCQICHREGDIAPFALNTYDDAVTWSRDIASVVSAGTMPPWKPVAGYGEFRGSYALTAREKAELLKWIEIGMPEGDPADLPQPAPDKGIWSLGQPDIVLQMPRPFTPPRGTDVYRCFVMPDMKLSQATYFSAIDLVPGNRQILHHAILFVDTTGTAEKKDGLDGQPGYDCFGGSGIPVDLTNLTQIFTSLDALAGIGGWAPGTRAHFLPDGIGIMLPANGRLVMQVHYAPYALTGPDQTQIGLYYARSTIQKRLYQIPIVNQTFTVPPNTVKDVVATFPPSPLPIGAKAITIFPHMHLLGRKIKVELTDAQKNVTPLIYEDNWEFNWQGAYTFAQPVAIPPLSTVTATCTFDNTENNPKNPNNPPVAVSWGERTVDEMCVAFLGVTLDVDPFTILRNIQMAGSAQPVK